MATLDDLVRELGLLRARAARGTRSARVSLDELASRVHEPKSTIHSYLTGRRLPPAQLLDRIVIALGSAPAELHEWAEAWYRVGAVRDAGRRGLANNQARKSVAHQLPLPVDGFIGRTEQLAELDESLAGSRPARIAVISGTAGVGKTALAVRWAHDSADGFPAGQLYLDLRGFDLAEPMPPEQALLRLLHGLGVPKSETPVEVDELAANYRSQLSGRRVLIVLDNARDAEQVRPLLPGSSSCAVLVTSRDSMAGLVARHGGHRIELPLLPMADATELLRELIGDQAAIISTHPASTNPIEVGPAAQVWPAAGTEQSALRALADRCARLPLALRIAAELVTSRPGMSIGYLAEELSDGPHQLDLLEAGDDARSALRTVFSWSYRRLAPSVATAFRLISVHSGADLGPAAMAALMDSPISQAQRAIDTLARAHLVQEMSPGRYGLHSLLRSYADELANATDADADRRAALTRLVDHYLSTAVDAIALLSPGSSPADRDPQRNRSRTQDFTDPVAAGAWLDAEYVNLASAVQQSVDGDVDQQIGEQAEIVVRHLEGGGQLPAPRKATRNVSAGAR